jgi:glc operon protein GlcG
MPTTARRVAGAVLVMAAGAVQAEPLQRLQVGLALAERYAASCEAYARAQALNVAIAVVDVAGATVLLKRMDGAGFMAADLALAKARTAAAAGTATANLKQALAGGALGLLSLDGVAAVGGGVPVFHDKTLIGGIGVSGASEEDDAACAASGLGPAPND